MQKDFRKIKTGVRRTAFYAAAFVLAGAGTGIAQAVPGGFTVYACTEQAGAEAQTGETMQTIDESIRTYDVTKFRLPAGAKTLVVVEGYRKNSGKETYDEGYTDDPSLMNRVRVTAYQRHSDTENWVPKVQSAGLMGWGGMSNTRKEGDGTTPIGLFKLNTPFGRKDPEEGFPADYIRIYPEEKKQYWSDKTNRLEVSADESRQIGEKLWQDWADGVYDYALDSGFNKNNANGNGSALFLHCGRKGKPSTGGCVAVEAEAMKEILKMYAAGDAYIAQAPEGQFDQVYVSYNETGRSPEGTFASSEEQPDETPTILQ